VMTSTAVKRHYPTPSQPSCARCTAPSAEMREQRRLMRLLDEEQRRVLELMK
jgi:hypothetical protein